MQYPKEAPVFRIKDSVFESPGLDVGDIVVAIALRHHPVLIGCYAFDHEDPAARNNGDPENEPWGWWFADHELTPLTPTAREMLAIARGAR